MRRKTRKWVIYSNDTVSDHVLEPVSIESSQDNSDYCGTNLVGGMAALGLAGSSALGFLGTHCVFGVGDCW